jgi:hypothetical protein
MLILKIKDLKTIPDFPDYLADIYGNIYSIKNHGHKLLKGGYHKDGYKQVTLRKNNKQYCYRVSLLILLTFVGPRPEGFLCCHGSQGNKDDSLSNLSWGTPSKNNGEDRLRDDHDVRGEKCWNAKLTKENILEIKRLYLTRKYTQLNLAKLFKTTRSNICHILTKRSWAWL